MSEPLLLSALQVKLQGGEVIGAPTPADVMASASRTVLTKLDRVEGQVIDFFMPAATRLIAGPHPERVLAAALAAMSGFRCVLTGVLLLLLGLEPRALQAGYDSTVCTYLLLA